MFPIFLVLEKKKNLLSVAHFNENLQQLVLTKTGQETKYRITRVNIYSCAWGVPAELGHPDRVLIPFNHSSTVWFDK